MRVIPLLINLQNFQGPVNIPPPILGNFYNQGGDDDGDDDDDDGDDHEHEDEQYLPTRWYLATYFNGSPLLVCIQGIANVTEEAGSSIVSHGRTLRTYANFRCRLFGMDTSVLAPRASPWFNIDSLGEHSLFLGLNYPMMVKGDPAPVGTTLPFMRSNSIYTTDIAVVAHYSNASIAPDIGRFSPDGESCVGLKIDNTTGPWSETRFWFKASVTNAEDWLT
jgi:hypothetical protein